ncbi:hemerythrin domain-containing protein [Mycolicibacterium neworleansense]|uniref:Hemerythrin HHE cation binding domain-containing protein n=1 Tax=Mycolicibacterium neworleansense TaxID=146018 RepID=A0A0H5RVH6_9MYCO|nr:hemerythrin domain-containing protein [Mycolicibacterium neworleansense]MCV7362611.1 hemerythrin domain-containing protein [Mycolicibacterium neworleansense]CRZ17532.1 hemerythrin HHE cation binding domain-containing protein [Mycolicibacterium neworleansense]
MPTTVTVAPRSEGDPAPDLLGITLAHRAMLADLLRLTDLATAVRDRDVICTPGRARAISRYIEWLCDSIHHHHTTEDTVLWPVIQASVGDHVDLSELTDDHAALDPRLDQLRARAAAFRLSMGDRQIAGLMAIELAELSALLTDHINDEELEVFPLITEHVSVADWESVESAARDGSRMSFDGPRSLAVMTDDEHAAMAQQTGIALRLMLVALRLVHRRRERAVFGVSR